MIIYIYILYIIIHIAYIYLLHLTRPGCRSTWKLMHEKGISPSSVTLGCMVEALVNCAAVEEAAKLAPWPVPGGWRWGGGWWCWNWRILKRWNCQWVAWNYQVDIAFYITPFIECITPLKYPILTCSNYSKLPKFCKCDQPSKKLWGTDSWSGRVGGPTSCDLHGTLLRWDKRQCRPVVLLIPFLTGSG